MQAGGKVDISRYDYAIGLEISMNQFGQTQTALARRSMIAAFGLAALMPAAVTGAAVRRAFRDGQKPFAFAEVDVFSPQPLRGNPLAVVIAADALSDADMALFSKWTNLSETTFLLRPIRPEADYRVRIFSHGEELPFAGHPTLGSCHVWLSSGGKAKGSYIMQECGIGLVRLRHKSGRLAFEAPPLRQSQPVDPGVLDRIRRGLGLTEGEITASRLLDGGLEVNAVMIASRDRLLALKPDWPTLAIGGVGVIALWAPFHVAGQPDFEVRVFDQTLTGSEDPVTGSFNAAVARWLIGAQMAPDQYLVSQGTVMGRTGRIHVNKDADGLWIGGDVADRIEGTVLF